MHAGVGLLEAAFHVQRRAQREQPKALAVGIDIEVEQFLAEVDRAGDVDDGVLGVDHEHARRHDPARHAHVGRGAIDLDLVVAEQLADDVVADIQTGDLHQRAADHAVVDQQLGLAAGAAQQGRHGVALAGERHVAVDLAQRLLHGLHVRKQLLQAQPPHGQVHIAAHGRLAPVQLERGVQAAARHAETQRRQGQHAVVEQHMRGQVANGQPVAVHDAFAAQFHVGVHNAPAVGAELLHRQDLVRRLRDGLLAFGLDGLGAARLHADQRPQVGHAQQAGRQFAAQPGARLLQGEGDVAVQVAGAHLAIEIAVFEARALGVLEPGDQAAVGGVRRRIGQGHPGQGIQVGHRSAGQLQAQVQRAQAHGVGQGARHRDPGRADGHLGLHRKRLAGVAQRQHAADLARPFQRQVLVAAVHLPAERVIGRRGRRGGIRRLAAVRLAGRLVRGAAGGRRSGQLGERHGLAQWVDQHVEVGLRNGVRIADGSLVEADRVDIHLPGRGLARIGHGEFPVGHAIGAALQVGAQAAQLDAPDDHALPQQRQGRQAEFAAAQRQQVGIAGPDGVGDGDIMDDEMRPRHPAAPAALPGFARPLHAEVALDGERPAQRGARLLVDGRLQAIPVQRGQDHQHGRQQDQHGAGHSQENLLLARHPADPFALPPGADPAVYPCLG
ncbi:Uncharacterised protein [Bordetella pertussis]|nr:Uncharacterised protein [Bordetella pertussis]CPO23555.1 Uncharacterised protein [Bordetella pertussis]CRE13427.1 Uncharacterised protein [Bordetella pertussis]